MSFSAYVICATPRSGSTMLCDLLAASGVAGRPQSYFRSQDVEDWARCWGVALSPDVGDPAFGGAYVAAVAQAGADGTGVFGPRLMWESLAVASALLDAARGDRADIAAQTERAFGPALFIHLSRADKLAQAISFLRAEQTGLWHVAADGTERERTGPPAEPVYDAGRIAELKAELTAQDAAWAAFFERRRIAPLRLFYEGLAADPRPALADVLRALGRDPAIARDAAAATSKMADAVSLSWAERFARECGAA